MLDYISDFPQDFASTILQQVEAHGQWTDHLRIVEENMGQAMGPHPDDSPGRANGKKFMRGVIDEAIRVGDALTGNAMMSLIYRNAMSDSQRRFVL